VKKRACTAGRMVTRMALLTAIVATALFVAVV
jgi:hypothetical protein